MTALTVTAPLVLVRDERGRTLHAYRGAVVDVVDADHARYLIAEGMASAVEPVERVVGHADTAVEVGVGVSRPPHVAPKARWVDFAVEHGFDRVEAESMSKAALISALT